MLSVIDVAEATDNLWGERWSKLCQNAMSNPVQAMTGLGSVEVLSSEAGRTLSIHLAAESARVGLKLGYRIPNFGGAATEKWANADQPSTYQELDRLLTPTSEPRLNWRSSMAQDVIKGRRTEIDFMNGHIVNSGSGGWRGDAGLGRSRGGCARDRRRSAETVARHDGSGPSSRRCVTTAQVPVFA